MDHRYIGALSVSVVGLGTNNFGPRIDEARSRSVIDAALDVGINFFDTADMYGQGTSEEFIGRAIQGRRDQIILATKFGKPMKGVGSGASAKYIRTAIEASLKRLQTHYIDLYQQHAPDPETPLDETTETLVRLIEEGKVREVGYSNFDAQLLADAQQSMLQFGKYGVSLQNEYSLLHREPEYEVLAACEEQHVSFLPFFPLAGGMLSGKYRKGMKAPEGARLSNGYSKDFLNEDNLERVEDLIAFAKSRGHELIDLAFSWLLSRAAVASVIAGATSPEQVKRNAAAADWQLTTIELSEIDSIAP